MKSIKSIASFALAISMLLSTTLSAYADSNVGNNDDTISIYTEGPYEPLGVLSDEEIQELLESSSCNCPQTRHFSLRGQRHEHEITAILDEYNEKEFEFEVTTSGYTSVAQTLVARRNVSVENSYSASIGFSEDVVSAELGFDVTMSEVNEAEDSIVVDPYKYGRIRVYSKYRVVEFSCLNTYYFNTTYTDTETETQEGTGAARQWIGFDYEASVSSRPFD